MTVRISVVIPTHNRCDLIAETLRAVISQSLPPQEIIVVDDESTDNTSDVISQFPSIHYVRVRRGGPGRARNAGVAIAQGDWIAFCDSDDIWRPNYLETFATGLKPESVYGFSNFVDVFDDHWTSNEKFTSIPSEFFSIPQEPLYRNIAVCNPVWPSTVWINRDFFVRIGGFNPKFSRYATEDFEFTLRCNEYPHAVVLHEPLVGIRKHQGNHSKGRIRQHLSDAAILEWSAINHRLGRLNQAEVLRTAAKRRVAALNEAFLLGDLAQVRQITRSLPKDCMSLNTKIKSTLAWSRLIPGFLIHSTIGRTSEFHQNGTYTSLPATLE